MVWKWYMALLASSVKQRCDSVTYTHCRDLQNTTNGVTENYGNILNGLASSGACKNSLVEF